ncbi:LPS-assembly lipoprotein LptE [Basilea psittacipulmonis]|uniref:LPS-assembly lipoprotein LptE n=1 Tax=Basilea psittacipulmonis DSM 24701 TaxID=1072685 RepID=A0A077DDX4_9BURK|nr:LPS assembly lipoprotein LptE [Basilea psittacipulmonis]AIL32336.1 hypothetical protein IX83_02490 [Basilea psittacipulmonis DSM 24701]
MKFLKFIAFTCISLILAGCGFKLQQPVNTPFTTIYTNIDHNSDFGAKLISELKANAPNLRFVNNKDDAQVQLIQLSNTRSKLETAINANGYAEEYLLNLDYRYTLIGPYDVALIPPTRIIKEQYFSYNENQESVKNTELSQTYDDMETPIITEITKRVISEEVSSKFLSLSKPK